MQQLQAPVSTHCGPTVDGAQHGQPEAFLPWRGSSTWPAATTEAAVVGTEARLEAVVRLEVADSEALGREARWAEASVDDGRSTTRSTS